MAGLHIGLQSKGSESFEISNDSDPFDSLIAFLPRWALRRNNWRGLRGGCA
jgi:hypothetical protein